MNSKEWKKAREKGRKKLEFKVVNLLGFLLSGRAEKNRSWKRYFSQITETMKACERWCLRTPASSRTIENLMSYLIRNRKILPFPPEITKPKTIEDEEDCEFLNLKQLAHMLHARKLDFRLSPKAVDAILRPKHKHMYVETEWGGYQFFLEHYHEHPFLEELIRKSISDPLRLRVRPALMADGPFAAWLFDPWSEKVYQFSANDDQDRDFREKRKDGRFLSVAHRSICKEYQGKDHGFSDAYLAEVKMLKEAGTNRSQPTSANQPKSP